MTGSNRRHPPCKGGALPTELIARAVAPSSESSAERAPSTRALVKGRPAETGGHRTSSCLGHRMTVAHISNEEGAPAKLVAHSPTPLSPELQADLSGLGGKRYVLAPSTSGRLLRARTSLFEPSHELTDQTRPRTTAKL